MTTSATWTPAAPAAPRTEGARRRRMPSAETAPPGGTGLPELLGTLVELAMCAPVLVYGLVLLRRRAGPPLPYAPPP
jgi:hypothetical protein